MVRNIDPLLSVSDRPPEILKRFLKLLVSLGVYSSDCFCTRIRSLLRKPSNGSCTVLYYHEVVEADRKRFAAQLDVICREAQVVSALESRLFLKSKKYVAITVDDAFISFFRNGLPETERRNIPVLVFVPTAWLGRKVDWAMEEVMSSPNEIVATLAELKESVRHPLLQIGSHTANHRKLTLLSDVESRKELSDSKEFLERELGCSVETISFPYGGFSTRDVHFASQLGYKTFFTTSPETVTGKLEGKLVGRFRIDPSDWMLEVKLKAGGAYRWQLCLRQLRSYFRTRPTPEQAESPQIMQRNGNAQNELQRGD